MINQARILLMAAKGATNNEISEQIGLSHQIVPKWRQRYLKQGLSGLHEESRLGWPRSISDETVAFLVRKTLNTKPKDATHWTIRSIAKQTNLSHPTVYRIWRAFGLQPRRQRHFKLSTDPFFVEKVRDIVELYLNPPDKAMVSCVDEKSQKIKRWLALHPRYQVHYTPTYASCLNQVEVWFNLITQRAIRRGTFKSVKKLITKIESFVLTYNRDTHPFVWTATADSILEKIKRLCQRISETRR